MSVNFKLYQTIKANFKALELLTIKPGVDSYGVPGCLEHLLDVVLEG